jgi:hypothetical protein
MDHAVIVKGGVEDTFDLVLLLNPFVGKENPAGILEPPSNFGVKITWLQGRRGFGRDLECGETLVHVERFNDDRFVVRG